MTDDTEAAARRRPQADDRFAGLGAAADGDQVPDRAGEDLGASRVGLLAGLVVAAAQAAADAGEDGLGLGQGGLAGVADGSGFLR
jgi:hypothetical protein